MPVKKNLTTLARKLRKSQTPQEAKVWGLLQNKSLVNLKFRRQYPIGNYIADFCCPKEKLVIELDGSGHNKYDQIAKDERRDLFFKSQGFKVLRVWNNELDKSLENLVDKIIDLIT